MLRATGNVQGTGEIAIEQRTAIAFVLTTNNMVKTVSVEVLYRFGRTRFLPKIPPVPPRDDLGDVQILCPHEQLDILRVTMHVSLAAEPSLAGEVGDPPQA